MLLRHSGVIAGAALALCAVAASAQPAPAEHGRQVQPQERTVVIRRGDDMGAHQAEHLRAILQLKPAQEGALSAYLDAMRPGHDRDQMMRMRGERRAKTTPEKLARMEARMTQREGAMRARIAATKRFYDQLDPAQKRAFDELPLMMGGPAGPMMGGMKIMHRGHGPGARLRAERFEEPMPPLPPRPPVPPRS